MSSQEIYKWLESGITTDINLQTNYTHNESKSFTSADLSKVMLADDNINYIVQLIIERADPMRNNSSIDQRQRIYNKVKELLEAWKNVGKFDYDTIEFEGKKLYVRTMSPTALIDHYNTEFVQAFGESILPASDVFNVKSVVNPNGLYAQQDRIIKINSRPVLFSQRSNFRRLHDTVLDQRVDETETFFYRKDTNPYLPESERKKTNTDLSQQKSYLNREGIAYRMKPNY